MSEIDREQGVIVSLSPDVVSNFLFGLSPALHLRLLHSRMMKCRLSLSIPVEHCPWSVVGEVHLINSFTLRHFGWQLQA